MKVILKEDIKNLGKKGQMVETSDGYARNYLIPRELAVQANSANINEMKLKQKAEQERKKNELDNARKLAERLKGVIVTIKGKAGENGRLYGAVTSADIAEALRQQYEVDVDKKKVHLPEPIKAVSENDIEISLYPEVSVRITVKVEAE